MMATSIIAYLRTPKGADAFQRRTERLRVPPPFQLSFWRPTTQQEFDDGKPALR